MVLCIMLVHVSELIDGLTHILDQLGYLVIGCFWLFLKQPVLGQWHQTLFWNQFEHVNKIKLKNINQSIINLILLNCLYSIKSNRTVYLKNYIRNVNIMYFKYVLKYLH